MTGEPRDFTFQDPKLSGSPVKSYLDWNDWTISIVQMAQHVTVGSPYVTMVGNQFCHFHWRMTPVEALRAATSASAECLGVGNESLGFKMPA